MFNLVCPISSSTSFEGHYVFDLPENVRKELNLFDLASHKEKIVRTKSCPFCEGQIVSLLVSLIFSGKKLILMDVPVAYCLREKCVRLAEAELISIRKKYRQAVTSASECFVPTKLTQRTGVGNRISDPVIGDEIKSALNVTEQNQVFYSADINALSFDLSAAVLDADSLPDSIAFHSNALPDTMSLKFEPTTRCNFKCEFCYGRHLSQGDLDFEDFINILDRMPFIKAIELTGEGEPLLNIHLLNMLRVCSERGIWTHITTNASMLKEDRCRKLLDTGVDSLAISLEAFNAEQFEAIRIGGKFEKVVNGIRTIARVRKEREKPLELRLWVTLLKETLSHVDEINAFAKEVGIDLVEYQTLNSMSSYARFYTPELRQNLISLSEMKEIVSEPSTAESLRNALSDVIAVYQGKKCDIFMNTIMANWQGYITPCCLLKSPDFQSFGNLNINTFETLWNKEDYRFFRFALQHGVVLESCRECPDVASAV